MKKRKLFLLAFVLVIAAALFVGCAGFESQVDPNVHTCKVTIHANGGTMNEVEVRTFYVEEGSPLPEPTVFGNVIIYEPVLLNHTIEGFYRVTLGENNEILSWGEKWDFQWDHVTGNVDLAVLWARDMTFEFVGGKLLDGGALPSDFAFDNPEADLTGSVSANNIIKAPTPSKAPKAIGYTFIGYFKDAACTQPIQFPYTLTEQDIADYDAAAATDPNYNMPIYTQWLKGEYILVNEASDFTNIGANSNYYFMVDEINMTGLDIRFPSTYRGTIEGNGCLIKNLTVSVEQAGNRPNTTLMFATLTGAKIRNITFENLVAEYVIVHEPEKNNNIDFANVTFFCESKDANTVLENVNISATLKVSHKENKIVITETGSEYVANDYECDVTFYSFDREEASKLGTIKTGDAVQEISFVYPAAN